MKDYAVGTIMSNRVAYCEAVVRKAKKGDPANETRGTFRIARSIDVSSMIALMWLDNNAVHFLSTGAAGSRSTVMRRVEGAADQASSQRLPRR